MSSIANANEPEFSQRTIHEAINARRIYHPIRGVHPRVELPDPLYEDWLDGNRDVKYVVINFSHAAKVIERDGDLHQVLEPGHIPIILGTEDDDIVKERSLQNILDLLHVVQPAIYVPDIGKSYRDKDGIDPEDVIKAYKYHVRALQKKILDREYDIRLIPTNKGWTVEHFEMYQDLCDQFNYSEFAFYAVQYTGGDAGNLTRVLRRHVTYVISALELKDVFIIGRLSRDDLLRFDPRVKGATGLHQWKDACLTEHGLSREKFRVFQEKREMALSANDNQKQGYVADFTGVEA